MNKKIIVHFQNSDPILFTAIQRVGLAGPSIGENYFVDLVEAIIGQQLSEKAGATIYGRFKALFPKGITVKAVQKVSHEAIRAVGTSNSKASFIKNLANFIETNSIDLSALVDLSDEDVVEKLTKIKGIGPWTSEMFLMFSLGRPDVFSFGDVGLRRAIQKLYKMKSAPTKRQMERISNKWRPYRTYACRVLWKTLDNQ